MTTVTANLSSVLGTGEAGSVVVRLCGYGPQQPRVPASGVLARTASLPVMASAAGLVTFTLYPNDQITPAGTYYTITFLNANGDAAQVNAYQFTGPNTAVDLAAAAPFDPTTLPVLPIPPPITPQLAIVPWTPTPNFDGSTYLSFLLTLTGPTAPTFTGGVPGNLYTFVLTQPSVAQAWTPPANMAGLSDLSTGGQSLIQTFLCIAGGGLTAADVGRYF